MGMPKWRIGDADDGERDESEERAPVGDDKDERDGRRWWPGGMPVVLLKALDQIDDEPAGR